MRIVVDLDLCQGHGVCESEAPSVFVVEKGAESVTILTETPKLQYRTLARSLPARVFQTHLRSRIPAPKSQT